MFGHSSFLPAATGSVLPDFEFETVIYTGNSSTQSITGVGFQPDLVWIKRRNTSEDHAWFDSVRGALKQISSNLTAAEYTTASPYEGVSSFDSDGFTTGNNGATNRSPNTYVSWNFKAGGSASSNTDGTITSQVSASTGFSIVSYTGSSPNKTIGHGLGVTPEFIIVKNRDTTGNGWATQSPFSGGADYHMMLNLTQEAKNNVDWIWNDTEPTSTVFSVGQNGISNQSGDDFIAYCFASVAGVSKIGSYTGTGSTGNVVSTSVGGDAGFLPAFLLVKRSDAGSSNWFIYDNKRDTNPNGNFLIPNSAQAEANLDAYSFYFNSNNFTVNSSDPQLNASGGTYIYMTFA